MINKNKMHRINGPELSFQVDLMFLSKALKSSMKINLQKTSSDLFVFLLCVDILSRKAFIYPLANKTKQEIMRGYKEFLNDVVDETNKLIESENYYSRPIPYAIITDDEFNFKEYKEINEKLDIILDSKTANDDHIVAGNRLGIIDRTVRTLKSGIMKYVYSNSTYKIKELVGDIVENYNQTPHIGIYNFTPNNVFENKELRYKVFLDNLDWNRRLDNFLDLNVGDSVRILEDKGKFGKERPQFSKEIYKVSDFKGNKVKVQNGIGEPLKRVMKPAEVQKVDPETVGRMAQKNATTRIEKNKKAIKTNQTLAKEGIEQKNVVRGNRRKRSNID